MYRKNRLLKKPAFAMIMAIIVLVVMATIMAFSVQFSSLTNEEIVEQYVKNQAELYAKNAAEFAKLLIAEKHTKCEPQTIDGFSFDNNGVSYADHNHTYNVYIDLNYAYSNTSCSGHDYIDLQDTPYEYGYVSIDVAVAVDGSKYGGEDIRVVRRFIEDITPYLQ